MALPRSSAPDAHEDKESGEQKPRCVQACETIRHHELLVISGDEARRYTGANSAVGVDLALASEDIEVGSRGAVDGIISLDLDALTELPESAVRRSEHDIRVFDAQIGRVWTRMSAAVLALRRNQRGQPTISCVVDGDDIIVRSKSMWKAFGFILDRTRHQPWGWKRRTYTITFLPLALVVTYGRLNLVYETLEVSEDHLVQTLERGLWP